MLFKDAQKDMRQAYLGGATGALVSGLVWIIAGLVALSFSEKNSIIALFIGGMFIFPISNLLDKFLFKRSAKHSPDNPLGQLALESTVLLFIGLFIAFAVAQKNIEWFYPIMLLTIGGRYLTFATLYGMRIYWLLGALLALAGVLLFVLNAPFVWGAFIGGMIEIVFFPLIMHFEKKAS